MPDPCCICCTGEAALGVPEGALGKSMTEEEQAAIQKGLAASQIVLFGPIVPLFLMQDRLRPGEGPPGGWGNRGDGGDHGGDYRPPEDDYEVPDYEVPDWGDYVPPEWPSRRLQDFDNSDFIPFGDPSLVTDVILASFIATFFYSVSVFCDFPASMNLNLALASATLLFFAMVDGFNAIRSQLCGNRHASSCRSYGDNVASMAWGA